MAELNRSNDTTNLGPGQLTINQGQFRTQQDVIGDSQQLGVGEVSPGASVNDPLSAPFVLYVNPYIGKDDIVFGSYASSNTDVYKRIELQRLQCGYTEAAPFKSLNRAIVSRIITSKDYFNETATIPFERVCIVLAPGTYDLNCGGGSAPGDVSDYDESSDTVDDTYLLQFNPQTVGGIICPAAAAWSASTCARPFFAPKPERFPTLRKKQRLQQLPHDAACNRRGLLLRHDLYGSSGATKSHHLMSCFELQPKGRSTTSTPRSPTPFRVWATRTWTTLLLGIPSGRLSRTSHLPDNSRKTPTASPAPARISTTAQSAVSSASAVSLPTVTATWAVPTKASAASARW